MLQETPDPITKVTWDNYVTMAHSDMDAMGLNGFIGQEEPASVVKVTVGDTSMELPVFPQPGQAPGTIGLLLGYGRGGGNEALERRLSNLERRWIIRHGCRRKPHSSW